MPATELRWDIFAQAAASHAVVGAAWLGVQGTAPPSSELHRVYVASRARHLALIDETHRVLQVLDEASVRSAAVKGVVLAETVYPRPDLRVSQDVDVIVEASSFASAVESLEAAGYSLLARNWLLMRDLMPPAVTLLSPTGILVDLQWSLVADARMRCAGNATPRLLDRARVVSIGGSPLRTLDRADTFVHTCMHAAQSGADRLMWLEDARMVAMAANLDDARERAMEWEVAPSVAFALLRAARVFRSPQESCESLQARRLAGSGVWRVVSDLASRLPQPYIWNPDAGHVLHSVARAARRNAASSDVELVRRGIARILHGPQTDRGRLWMADEPISVMYETGGASERAAYFAAVETAV